MTQYKIKHFSHVDLDGITPIIFTKFIMSHVDEAWKANNEITLDTEMLEAGEKTQERIKEFVEKNEDIEYDLTIITDLRLDPEILKIIAKNIPISKLLICDHHKNIPLKEIQDMFLQAYSNFYAEIRRRIVITSSDVISSTNQAANIAFNPDAFKDAELGQYSMTHASCGTSLYFKYGLPVLFDQLGIETFNSSAYWGSKKYKTVLGKMREVAEFVRLYDTYEWKESPNMPSSVTAARLNLMHQTLDVTSFSNFVTDFMNDESTLVYDITDRFLLQWSPAIYHLIEGMEKEKIDYIEKKISTAVFTFINWKYQDGDDAKSDTLFTAIMEAEKYSSELGNTILERDPKVAMAMIINGSKVSLRSMVREGQPDVDCSKYAEYLGGGGHPRAAGYVVFDELRQVDLLIHAGHYAEMNHNPVPEIK